ncbi:unnamed protein product [Hermetia illucens]|uniref:Uncharacterized protein n=1 Tax=Hermetia illucens TaxID=343691 RepID=A0A7R8YTK1_HERIL|nr:unnamed protein product [Hermetia illucens]
MRVNKFNVTINKGREMGRQSLTLNAKLVVKKRVRKKCGDYTKRISNFALKLGQMVHEDNLSVPFSSNLRDKFWTDAIMIRSFLVTATRSKTERASQADLDTLSVRKDRKERTDRIRKRPANLTETSSNTYSVLTVGAKTRNFRCVWTLARTRAS